MRLKQNLKHLLELRGLSAAGLARMSNTPKQTLADWMAGVSPKDLSSVKRVATALGVTLDELCFAEEVGLVRESEGTPLNALLGDEWVSGLFEIKLRRIKR